VNIKRIKNFILGVDTDHILYKYKNGKVVDDEDLHKVEFYFSTGLMKQGTHECIDNDRRIHYQTTARTTKLGMDYLKYQ